MAKDKTLAIKKIKELLFDLKNLIAKQIDKTKKIKAIVSSPGHIEYDLKYGESKKKLLNTNNERKLLVCFKTKDL